MNKSILAIILLLLMYYNYSYPANYRGAREWLMQPPSARCAGMGGGTVAIIDNANTVFWNPGGIVFLNGLNLSYTYDPYKSASSHIDSKIHNFSINSKFKGLFTVGLNFRQLKYYSSDLWFVDTKFKDIDIGISFGYKMKNIGVGINTKYLLSKRDFFNVKNTPLAIDIGMLYSRNYNIKNLYLLNFNFGISLLNSSNGIEYEYYENKYLEGLPNIIKIGYATTFKLSQEEKKLTFLTITHNIEYSDVINKDKNIYEKYRSLGFGFESLFYEIIQLNIGYHYFSGYRTHSENNIPYNGLTYGFGLEMPVYVFYKSFPLSVSYNYARFPWETKSYYREEHYFRIHSFNFKYKF